MAFGGATRRFAGAGLMRRPARAAGGTFNLAAFVDSWKDELDAIAAGSALHAWITDPSTVTLNGSNISQILDSWGAAPMVQGTAANQPPYVASGGPGGRPFANLSADVADRMTATLPAGYVAGNRLSLYAVTKASPDSADRQQASLTETSSLRIMFYAGNGGSPGHRLYYDPETGSTFNGILTVPAMDLLWHVRAQRPIASGAVSQMDGVTTTPNPAGDALPAVNEANIGRPGNNNAGGALAAMFVVNDATDAKNTVMLARIARLFGSFPA